MICRAKGCRNISMPHEQLCGAHDELAEDHPIDMKPKRVAHKILTNEEKAERWEAIRERERESKRRNHPEWRKITRNDGARTVDAMAALYDARRNRERNYRENNLAYSNTETRRAAVKDAALEVLAEVKRKREERRSRQMREAS